MATHTNEKLRLKWVVYIMMCLSSYEKDQDRENLFARTMQKDSASSILYLLTNSHNNYMSWCTSFCIMSCLWKSPTQRMVFQKLNAPSQIVRALADATWTRRCALLGALLVVIRDHQNVFLDAGGLTPCLSLLWQGLEENGQRSEEEEERWKCCQELLMRTIYDVGTSDVKTARRLVAILTSSGSTEGEVLEKLCGYRSVFFVLFRVASPSFTPLTRKLAAKTIRELRSLLLHSPPLDEVMVHGVIEKEKDDKKSKEEARKVVNQVNDNKNKNDKDDDKTKAENRTSQQICLSSTYNVRSDLRSVAGEHSIVRLAVDFCNEKGATDPDEIVRLDGVSVLASMAMLGSKMKEIIRQCGGIDVLIFLAVDIDPIDETPTSSEKLQHAALRALCNICFLPRAQLEVCRKHLYPLIRLGWTTTSETISKIVSELLSLLKSNKQNRNHLYKAELKIKTLDLRGINHRDKRNGNDKEREKKTSATRREREQKHKNKHSTRRGGKKGGYVSLQSRCDTSLRDTLHVRKEVHEHGSVTALRSPVRRANPDRKSMERQQKAFDLLVEALEGGGGGTSSITSIRSNEESKLHQYSTIMLNNIDEEGVPLENLIDPRLRPEYSDMSSRETQQMSAPHSVHRLKRIHGIKNDGTGESYGGSLTQRMRMPMNETWSRRSHFTTPREGKQKTDVSITVPQPPPQAQMQTTLVSPRKRKMLHLSSEESDHQWSLSLRRLSNPTPVPSVTLNNGAELTSLLQDKNKSSSDANIIKSTTRLHPKNLQVLHSTEEHLPSMTVQIHNDPAKYRFQASSDIYAEPSDIIRAIDEEYKKLRHLHHVNGDVETTNRLHMFRKVEGASIGTELFTTSYTLPDGQGKAFAYMPYGPRQQPIDGADELVQGDQSPSRLVCRDVPSCPNHSRMTSNFPTPLSLPQRGVPPLPQNDLLLPTPKGMPPGSLRDPALELWAEMWPAYELAADGKPPSLECGTCCGNPIVQTVLVRNGEKQSKSNYYHPHCVCFDCDRPLMEKLRVPWLDNTRFYHPDCTCQFCYQPIIAGEEETVEKIQAEKPYRYAFYRFHKRCPKIVSPPFNSIICHSCQKEIKDEEVDLKVSAEDGQKYHKWCMETTFVFKSRLRAAESNAYYDHNEHIKAIFDVDWRKISKRKMFHGLLEDCRCNARKLKKVVCQFYERLCDVYDLYGGFGRFDKNDPDDAFELQKNEVKQWATDSKILNSTDASWNRLFTFFLAANVELDADIGANDLNAITPDPKDDEAWVGKDELKEKDANDEANDDTSLVRFEFLVSADACLL
jgi:hypothetical protein